MLDRVVGVMAFNECGQAASAERRIEMCKRVHRLLTGKMGCDEADIIFDLNTFAIATGIAEYDGNAVSSIKRIRLIRLLFPSASIAVGISNLSFAFRGSSEIRRGLHAEFLKHAFWARLNITITNIHEKLNDTSLCVKVEAVYRRPLFNVNPHIPFYRAGCRRYWEDEIKRDSCRRPDASSWMANVRFESKNKHAVVNELEKHIGDDGRERRVEAVDVVKGVLMDVMNVVRKLFGDSVSKSNEKRRFGVADRKGAYAGFSGRFDDDCQRDVQDI
ncbi:MAG: dihydropteroate synthase [Candidatus Hodgkinia cicadicola]